MKIQLLSHAHIETTKTDRYHLFVMSITITFSIIASSVTEDGEFPRPVFTIKTLLIENI